MPVIRINADGDQPALHDNPRPVAAELAQYASETGPVIAMIHGYKYRPGDPVHCPHRTILSRHPADYDRRSTPWLRQLGFGTGHADEGLAIAFGWQAQSVLWQAQKQTARAGQALAQVLCQLHQQNPARPIHLIAHSLGANVAFEALHHLQPGAISRFISMTGASYQSSAIAALSSPAGREVEFINVTSRENDPFDFLFERLISPPQRGDRVIGHGLNLPNAVTLQMDCPATLTHLRRLGAPVDQPDRRVCHWSTYTRPGILRFYNDLLRRPESLPLQAIRAGIPDHPARRWSRLFAPPVLSLPLPFAQKTS